MSAPAIFPEYGQKTAHQVQESFEIKKVKSPNCDWFTLTDFSLAKIPIMFEVAPFQRKVSGAHVYRIVESIINNKFFDNTIRCVKKPKGKYEVIDGQHRLKALWILHKQYGIRNYTIVMQYFKDAQAREVFRKINSGKKLTTPDHLKTLDDGTYPYFDELRSFCTHSAQQTILRYYNLLNSHKYATTHNTRPIKEYSLEEILEGLTPDDIAQMYRIAHATHDVYQKTMSSRIFNVGIQRPLLRIGVENNFSYEEYCKLLTSCIRSDKILELIQDKFSVCHEEIVLQMKHLWNERK